MLSLHSCCWGKSQLYPIYPLVEGQIPAESPLILDLGHPIAENRWPASNLGGIYLFCGRFRPFSRPDFNNYPSERQISVKLPITLFLFHGFILLLHS